MIIVALLIVRTYPHCTFPRIFQRAPSHNGCDTGGNLGLTCRGADLGKRTKHSVLLLIRVLVWRKLDSGTVAAEPVRQISPRFTSCCKLVIGRPAQLEGEQKET
jgi:hypothetical protein